MGKYNFQYNIDNVKIELFQYTHMNIISYNYVQDFIPCILYPFGPAPR